MKRHVTRIKVHGAVGMVHGDKPLSPRSKAAMRAIMSAVVDMMEGKEGRAVLLKTKLLSTKCRRCGREFRVSAHRGIRAHECPHGIQCVSGSSKSRREPCPACFAARQVELPFLERTK